MMSQWTESCLSLSANRIQTSIPIIFTSSRQLKFLANAADCMGALQHISFDVSGARQQIYFGILRIKHPHTV
jgi:hypothetical protein